MPTDDTSSGALGALHRTLTGPDASSDPREARNFAVHLLSLVATKTADGLIDPKLVLSWLLGVLGAPGYLIGALVPVREAGALLPQLGLAPFIQRLRRRKLVWAAGSALQGLAALGIAGAALTLDGAAAGWAVVGCLAVLAAARSACSASHKDILARTVEKGTRGTVGGSAGTAAASVVLAFAGLVSVGIIPREPWAIGAAIAVAGALWLFAAALFSRLDEPETEPSDAATISARIVRPLRRDAELRRYILTRGLLISTALAPPFLVLLDGQGDGTEFGNLGILMLASAAAAITSSYVLGRLADLSSRRTLAVSAALAALALGAAAAIGVATGGLGGWALSAGLLYVAQIAYEGVRAGRKTHLSDMDTGGEKPVYTALSNTFIGVLLLFGGGFGVLADLFGPAVVLACLAAMSAAAIPAALTLRELQD